jgi:uracil phosphoribosyltransferase
MLQDTQYLKRTFKLPEKEHRYGKNVHLVDDPYLFSTLSKLGRPDSKQPLINQLLNTIYREMVKYVVNLEFPLVEATLESRMAALHPEGWFRGLVVDPSTQVVCVNLARAGTVPSQICFDAFNYILNPDGVRQDHISINRKTNENNVVVGTNLGGVKIGGDVKGRFVVIPDPMGATGSTLQSAMEIYRACGPAAQYFALHLIVTPEYLKLAAKEFPEVKIFAIRLDRGLSPPDVLATVPGTHWDKERGLNANQYIVPGAGGIGEVINNAYV